eukprot:gene14655-18582_t
MLAKKHGKLTEVQELQALAAKGGVKGTQAKIKLAAIEQMGTSSYEREEEVKADRNKKKAERTVMSHAKETAAAEHARVEEDRRLDEEERARKRAEGKARMLAMASKFGATNSN